MSSSLTPPPAPVLWIKASDDELATLTVDAATGSSVEATIERFEAVLARTAGRDFGRG
jgi:hypothetical protein